MSLENLRASGSAAPAPGIRLQPTVTKLVDTSTCIGCKACEVACQEWNDLPPETTVQMGTYQTLPDMTANFWNLIKFNEHEDESGLRWLMRKDQCMHCAEPGCLVACPAPGAIVQYTNGIVDFQQDQCIGCGYCMTGCPFNVPEVQCQKTRRVYKCTLCVDRTSVGSAAGVRQGVSRRAACSSAPRRRCSRWRTRASISCKPTASRRPPSTTRRASAGRRSSRCWRYGDQPELYGLPRNPTIPLAVRLGRAAEVARQRGDAGRVSRPRVHFVRFGRKAHAEPARRPAEPETRE